MTRPNILIFMTDQERADVCFPEHPCRTPRLDAFGREGLWFRETHCPSPHCCPSRATFMTGLYPSQHGVWNNMNNEQALSTGLRPGVRCWSEELASAGYDLHYFGKWHVSNEEDPAARGWTEHTVSARSGVYMGLQYPGYRKWAQENPDRPRRPAEIAVPGYPPSQLYGEMEDPRQHQDEVIVAEAVEEIGRQARRTEPWCLYVGTFGPHDPYRAPREHLERYSGVDIPLPESFGDAMQDKPGLYRRMRRVFGQMPEDEYREAIRHYWAYCSWMDDLFGRVLNALEESGQAENTLVLFCSDHGDYAGEHGLFCKGIPSFSGAYHVPAVMRWPGKVTAPGRSETALISLADFGPTFLEAAGLPTPGGLAGRSLAPFLADESPANWRESIHTQCNGVELYATQRITMTRDWRYVFNGFDFDELYDRRRDPHQLRNLADDPAHAEVVREMVRRHWRFAEETGDGAHNNYFTVRLFPEGPGAIYRE